MVGERGIADLGVRGVLDTCLGSTSWVGKIDHDWPFALKMSHLELFLFGVFLRIVPWLFFTLHHGKSPSNHVG